MKPGWRVVAAAAAVYVLFMVTAAPAAKLVPLVAAQIPGVQLAGISGSLWSGRAVQVNAGTLVLTDVAWDVRLLGLFKAALEVDLQARLGGEAVAARAGRGLFGGRYLTDVQGRVTANQLLGWMNLNRMALDGYLNFTLDKVEWGDGVLPGVAGTLDWSPALVTRPIELNLGSARLESVIESGATRGQINASGGALVVRGELVAQPDGNYRLDADLKKQGDVPVAVDRFLSTFTEFRDDSYRLEWSDTLQF